MYGFVSIRYAVTGRGIVKLGGKRGKETVVLLLHRPTENIYDVACIIFNK